MVVEGGAVVEDPDPESTPTHNHVLAQIFEHPLRAASFHSSNCASVTVPCDSSTILAQLSPVLIKCHWLHSGTMAR